MLKDDLDNVILEADRFLKRAIDLRRCTEMAREEHPDHYKKYRLDQGLHKTYHSKTSAAVKRSAIDLKNELSKLNRGVDHA